MPGGCDGSGPRLPGTAGAQSIGSQSLESVCQVAVCPEGATAGACIAAASQGLAASHRRKNSAGFDTVCKKPCSSEFCSEQHTALLTRVFRYCAFDNQGIAWARALIPTVYRCARTSVTAVPPRMVVSFRLWRKARQHGRDGHPCAVGTPGAGKGDDLVQRNNDTRSLHRYLHPSESCLASCYRADSTGCLT